MPPSSPPRTVQLLVDTKLAGLFECVLIVAYSPHTPLRHRLAQRSLKASGAPVPPADGSCKLFATAVPALVQRPHDDLDLAVAVGPRRRRRPKGHAPGAAGHDAVRLRLGPLRGSWFLAFLPLLSFLHLLALCG